MCEREGGGGGGGREREREGGRERDDGEREKKIQIEIEKGRSSIFRTRHYRTSSLCVCGKECAAKNVF
jgi:hypothetical protein